MKKEQKILVLGAQGMLGQALREYLEQQRKGKVIAWDYKDLDVTQEGKLREALVALRPDVIYNTVAYNAVDACETDQEEYAKAIALNDRVPKHLAQLSRELGFILVHYSTDYVFGGLPPQPRKERKPYRPLEAKASLGAGCCGAGCMNCPYKGEGAQKKKTALSTASFDHDFEGYAEEDTPKPLSLYGKTKYSGERAVEEFAEKFYIIRLSKLFGKPGTSPQAKKSFFHVMLELGKEKGEVYVVDGEVSAFTYAPDLAAFSHRLVDGALPFGIYHGANAGGVTWYEAVQELFQRARVPYRAYPLLPESYPRPAPRPQKSTLLSTKVSQLRPWQEALEEFLKSDYHVQGV